MKYRPEIDGLRTLAVLPVIFYHAGFQGFGGGFVGVDIFFVISGYLITSILVSDLSEGRFSLLRFYERRARRILPALFVVMAVSIPFAYLWMMPREFNEFGQSVVSVVVFASNILFWMQDDYFGAAAELKPLLHTWSLAVEEQFYILFPVILALLWRFGRKSILLVCVGLWLASFVLCEWLWRHYPSANFYLAPSRAWELLTGSLCAFALASVPRRPSNLLSMAGLALIGLSVFFYGSDAPFPSAYALAPVLGAALIILFAGPGTVAEGLLASRPIVAIGLISYSAYLWHQPLFAFARLRTIDTPGPAVMAALTVASLCLAWATWQFVEQPFRRSERKILPSRAMLFLVSAVVGLLFTATGLFLRNEGYFLAGLTDRQKTLMTFVDYKTSTEFKETYRIPDCFYGTAEGSFQVFVPEKCLARSKMKPNWLLLGDSHGTHLWRALQERYPELNIMQATASGCRPLIPLEGEVRCTDLFRYVFDDVLKREKVDGIILASRWRADDVPRVEETVNALLTNATQVVVLGPTVEYTDPLPVLLMRLPPTEVKTDRLEPYINPEVFVTAVAIEQAAKAAGAKYVEIAGNICQEGLCRVVTDAGVPMSWDYGHFTLAGARYAVSQTAPLPAVVDKR